MPAVLVTGMTDTQNSPFLRQRWSKPSTVFIAPTHGGMARLSGLENTGMHQRWAPIAVLTRVDMAEICKCSHCANCSNLHKLTLNVPGLSIDGLSVEHLLYSHPSLPFISSKLFKLIFLCRYVPLGFKKSNIVPIPKPKDCRSKAMTYDDFRSITVP